ncbi:hypothetical protein [Piscinibacter sp.]|uniref:hypothetical protein n=1 Tax=Piscinibacter sp. TaxID=1903157 RepID=UPI0039E29FFA
MRAAASLVLITLAAALASEPAQARPGRWRGGVSIGIGVPLYVGPGYYGGYYGGYYSPWYGPYGYPAPLVVAPPAAAYAEPPAPPPPPKGPPDPIFYPSRQQSAAQLEADRQECNRWATTQPAAMADAGVFHRATLACMEGRGYSVR